MLIWYMHLEYFLKRQGYIYSAQSIPLLMLAVGSISINNNGRKPTSPKSDDYLGMVLIMAWCHIEEKPLMISYIYAIAWGSKLFSNVFIFYASAFRRRRHYVFGSSVRPSIRPSVRPSVRPSEAWNTLFWPVHGSVGPPDQPLPFYGMSVRPSVRLSVRPSVRPSVRRGFRAFAGECMEGLAWNFTCWCILTTFRTD